MPVGLGCGGAAGAGAEGAGIWIVVVNVLLVLTVWVIIPRAGVEDVMVGGDGAGVGLEDAGGTAAAADTELGRKSDTESVVALANVGDEELEVESVAWLAMACDKVEALVVWLDPTGVDATPAPVVKPSSL